MQSFTTFRSMGIPVDIANCDTDQIIPARLLRNPRTDPDYPRFLFHDLRFAADGSENPGFIYNLSLIHISEPTRLLRRSRMPSSA